VVLWSAAAASVASDRMRKHTNSALAGQAFFSGFTGVSRRVKCKYACCAQFHSRNELVVHCLISRGSYNCNVEC